MSMSQYPDMDEGWDAICNSIRWWHIPLMVVLVFLVIPVTTIVFTVWWKLTGK